jgi:hypothetical protein
VTRGAKPAEAFAKLLEARLDVKDKDSVDDQPPAAQEEPAEAASEQ